MSVPFDRLSDSQKRVITQSARRLLVLAGPGTGKTEVLTHRIIFLINHEKVLPQEILAVTFSRNAAQGMKNRVAQSIGGNAEAVRISTLHSESLKTLGALGASPRFFVSDDEARMLMRDAIEDCGFAGQVGIKDCQIWVGLRKGENMLPAEIVANSPGDLSKFKAVYARYEELLRINRASDFGGLVVQVLRRLRTVQPEADPTSYVKHLLVDEFQDINASEVELIRHIARNSTTLFTVGDDDQSIYSFRGASPSFIRNFTADFTGQTEILQESNRCTDHILQGAKGIVSKASGYIVKSLQSARGPGNKIQVLISASERREAFWISNTIKAGISAGDWSLDKIAILCKSLEIARPVIDRLNRDGMPTSIWTSKGFASDGAVTTIMAYLRFFVDPHDNLALRTLIEKKTRSGIGMKGMTELRHLSESENRSLWDTMVGSADNPKLGRWGSNLYDLVHELSQLALQTVGVGLPMTIEIIANHLHVAERESVQNLIQVASNFPGQPTISDFLNELLRNRSLDLAGGVSQPSQTSSASIPVMTMHSSKGLGYETIFILGLDRGLLPDYRQDDGEQRRLLYVAMTRAMNSLYLCHSRRRVSHPPSRKWWFDPSPFISDIPSEHMDRIDNM